MRWVLCWFVVAVLSLQPLSPLTADYPLAPYGQFLPGGWGDWRCYPDSRFQRWGMYDYRSDYWGLMGPGYSPYVYRRNVLNPYRAWWLAPVYQPPGLLFGPQAVERFLGVGQVRNQLAAQRRQLVTKVRRSNSETRRRAERFIEFGDDRFAKQHFYQALQRYRTASSVAPDVAETYFRQGHALVALGHFDRAARAFKRALAMKPSLERSGFEIVQLYRDNQIAKEAHLEALAKAAWKHTRDDDLLFLLGLFLHYDGQAVRATKFFRRAFELAGPLRFHLLPFLPAEQPAKPENQALVQRLDI